MSKYEVRQVDLWLDQNESEAVQACLERRWLTEGPACKDLTKTLQDYTGCEYVTFAPNGTLGLFLALLALDLPQGAEVLVPSFTFYGSVTPIIFAGLKPVFVDVDPASFSATQENFEQARSDKTAAIMPVHMYGGCSNIEDITNWAKEQNIRVVEDAAQAMGAKFQGKALGSFGDVGVISLFSDKVITAGEGAIVLCRNTELYERVLLTRNQGRRHSGTFQHDALGMNFRITDIQAAVANGQMGKIDAIVSDRHKKWALYSEKLSNIKDLSFMTWIPGCQAVPFRFPVLTQQRQELAAALEKNGVETRRMFMPMHQQPRLRSYAQGNLPVSERLYDTGLCLPIHKNLSVSDVSRVCHAIRSFYGA